MLTKIIQAPGYGEPESLELVEVELPAPGAGEVRIAVRASGVNPADLKQLRGMFGRREGITSVRLGSEASGVVVEVGPDAVGPAGPIAVGDEVIAYRITGGYAEEIIAKASSVLPKPPTLSWERAAGLLAVGVTAEHLLEATRVAEGDRVIVHGASGGVGFAAVQLARLRGARVLGTASPTNHDRLIALGAGAIDYGPGLVERLRERLPDGADVALDTVGTDEALDASVELVADRSRIATIAGFQRAAELGILLLGSGPGADPGTEIRAAARLPLVKLAGEGKLDVVVGRTLPLAEAGAALRFLEEGHPGGKVILVP